ncbi:MAG TPA: CDP-glycerol glycerophosphotransferase family protein [Rickettsiales bacterium]|nr:CDP-glycerol glycerophosphotransferase family protein [Rickettsiales bacterium]
MDAFENCELIDCYSMFEYLIDREIECYYIINIKQKQYEEIKRKYTDKVIGIKYISLMHFSLFFKLLRTRYFLSSFASGSRILKLLLKNNKRIDYIFAQHGVVFTTERCFLQYNSEMFDKVVVANSIEKSIWKRCGEFKDKNFVNAGLCRWDLLKNIENNKEKSIFIFFTWRRSFENKNYIDSLYYKNIISLLENKIFLELLNNNNIKLYFGLHHGLVANGKKYSINNYYNIEFVEIEKISWYVKNCDLLITDYSSISFDFLFQEKPVIYYLLDKSDKFLNEVDFEAGERAFSQLNGLFNKVLSEDNVVDLVNYYIKSDFQLEKNKKDVVKKFFYYKRGIRKAIYEWMIDNW